MKKTIFILALFLLSIAVVLAQKSHDSEIEEGGKLVESKISCDNLTNEQLESIGDYYMEQMHPGEAHEIMDKMMGGEGSESLRQVHINMARRLYCNDNVYIGYGMMGGGMMAGSGMMGNYYYQSPQNNSISQNSFFGFQIFFYIILTFVIVVLILLVILLINKSNKGGNTKK